MITSVHACELSQTDCGLYIHPDTPWTLHFRNSDHAIALLTDTLSVGAPAPQRDRVIHVPSPRDNRHPLHACSDSHHLLHACNER